MPFDGAYRKLGSPPDRGYRLGLFPRQALKLLLDGVLDRNAADAHRKMDALLYGLDIIKRLSSCDSWVAEIEYIRQHPAFAEIHRTPLNRRAYEKPRGYAGDAVAIDMIYGIEPLADADPWVQAAHEWGLTTAACRAVNKRRETIAEAIEDTARIKPGARILSIACGHVRELELVSADAMRNVASFVCLDQDRESLDVVERDYGSASIELVESSVLDVLRGRVPFENKFDLVYSSGLYDYLDDRIARALTRKLTEVLADDGRLLVANFAPIPDIAYMEAIMDWKLLYRTDADMIALAPEAMQANNSEARPNSSSVVWLDLLGAQGLAYERTESAS